MYCYRCGHELQPRSAVCPTCDTPQKRRQRHRRRLLLGLFIFLAGAFAGSIFDSIVFKGRSWDHSLIDLLTGGGSGTASGPAHPGTGQTWETVSPPAGGKQPEVQTRAMGGNQKTVPPAVVAFKPGTPGAPSMEQLPAIDRDSPEGIPASRTAATETAAAGFDEVAAVMTPDAAVASETPAPMASVTETAETGVPAAAAVNLADLPDTDLAPDGLEKLETGPGNNYHGSLGADGDSLLFSSNRTSGGSDNKYQCYFRSLKGKGGAVRLFSWPGNVWTPEFSNDGKQLVFSSDSEKPEHVFIFERMNQQHRSLTDGKSKNMMPALSPDGKNVVFTSNRGGTNDIWMVGIDGKNLTQLTSGSEDDREPRWWPDGKSVIFTRILQKMKVSHIMKLSVNPPGKPETLIDEQTRNWLADPSPDGRWLAFVRSKSEDGSNNEIFIRRIDSGKELAVTAFGGSDAFRPIWTRDGSALVVHADREGRKSLYLIPLKKTPIH